MKYVGGCLCGSVSFEVNGKIEQVIHCHCNMCKKSHGSAFGSFAIVSQRDFQWFGEENIQSFNSSLGTERKFCKKCGSNLQWNKLNDPFNAGKVSFNLGLLDTTFIPEEEVHYFADKKAKWYLGHH